MRRSPHALDLARRAGFSVLTVALGYVGQLTFYAPAQISLVWPVSGVALLWLLTSSGGRALAVDCALLGASSALSVIIGIGGWDRAVVGAVLGVVPTLCMIAALGRLRRWRPGTMPGNRLTTLSDLFPFAAAVVTGGLVAAVLRAWGLGLIEPSGTANAVLTAVRTVAWTFVPGAVALTWVRSQHQHRQRPDLLSASSLARGLEAVLVLAATGVALTLVFTTPDPLPVLYPTFLVTVWASLRTPLAVATTISSAVGLLGICFTLAEDGPFVAVADARTGAVLAQGFMVCLTLVSLIMSLSLLDRQSAQRRAEDLMTVAQGRADLLDAVIANIAEGILVVQDDDSVILHNDAGTRLGSTPLPAHGAVRAAGEPYALWEADGSPVAPEQLPSRVVLDGSEHVPRDFTLRRADDVPRTVEVSAVRLPRVKHQRPRAVVTFRDVTQERTERTELEAFAGVVAHDLANPLTIITGWSEALEQEAGSPDTLDPTIVAAMSHRIMAASTHMHAFINDLLSYTTTRNQPLRVQDVDLTQLCRHVADLRATNVPGAQVSVQPDMTIRGDTALLRQLFDNLVGNSLKYVAPGTAPRVHITGEATQQHLLVTVRDNGIGIPQQDRAKVFGDFYRVESARGEYQGTGLGLAICQRVVTRHGGEIWVDPDHDPSAGGTVVHVTLPWATSAGDGLDRP